MHFSGRLRYGSACTNHCACHCGRSHCRNGAPTGGYRVHDVQVYNKQTDAYEPLDLTASYNLAGYTQILRNLGDGFNMFHGSVNVMEDVMEDYLVLANYITAFEGGVIEATNSPLSAKYPGMRIDYSDVNGCGRIVVEGANGYALS